MIPFQLGFFRNISQIGPCYYTFDGVNEYIRVPDTSAFNFIQNTDVFSLSLWVQFDDYTADLSGRMMGNNATTLNKKGFSISYENRISQGSPRQLKFSSSRAVSGQKVAEINSVNNVINDNDWHHIIYTSNGATGHIYIDGVDTSLSTDTHSILATGNSGYALDVGAGGNAVLPVAGNLDEVSLWDVALSASEASDIFALGRLAPDLTTISSYALNCISHYTFDDDTFSTPNWTVVDGKGSNTGTSANMNETNRICA